VAVFLSRSPARLAFTHRGDILSAPRYRIAALGSAIYLGIAAAAFAVALDTKGWRPAIPLIAVIPFAAVFAWYDLRSQVHSMVPEIMGPLGLAATSSALAVAAGWPWLGAFVLWLLMVARGLTSIFYVRARLRLERGQSFGKIAVLIHHVAFAGLIVLLIWRDLTPTLTALAFMPLALRATWGLTSHRRLTRTKHIGILEMVLGILYVMIIAAGYRLDI
jgi:hypothetical protein